MCILKEMLHGLRRELAAERKALHDEARELKASLEQQRTLDQHLLKKDRDQLRRDQERLIAEREAFRESLTDINVYRSAPHRARNVITTMSHPHLHSHTCYWPPWHHVAVTVCCHVRRVKRGIVDGSLVYPGEIVYTDEDVGVLEEGVRKAAAYLRKVCYLSRPLCRPLSRPLCRPLSLPLSH